MASKKGQTKKAATVKKTEAPKKAATVKKTETSKQSQTHSKLERPKGYSVEKWEELLKKRTNIQRFVREKTATGATVYNVPDINDLYTAEGRKKIREWTPRIQWKTTEFVDVETGEIFTGLKAKEEWSKAKSRAKKQEEPEPPVFDIYEEILSRLVTIPDIRVVYSHSEKRPVSINTGGMRSTLINMLKDIAEDTEYLMQNQEAISAGVQEITFASDQDAINHAYSALLTIFNGGKALSKKQWDELQDTALNY